MFKYTNRNRTKRRRVIPARPKRDPVPDPTPPIFQNVRAYIHPNNINGSRRKVLHNLIRKNGGVYSLVPNAHTTHVLVDEGVSSGKLCRSLRWTTFPPNINVLMVSWLSACLRAGRRLNPVDYEIPCTHRPTFAATQPCVLPESAAATGPTDDECIYTDGSSSSSSSSVLGEDADAELPNFEYVYEEGSTYDDEKYDEETSCDDEWLCIPPNIASTISGVVIPCNPNPCDMFPVNSFSPTSNLKTLESPPPSKKPKLESTPLSERPNTLAGKLSRVRVRRIPEHLRVPGGSSIIVDLNNEDFPQPSTSGISCTEIKGHRDANVSVNGTERSSADERCNLVKVQSKLPTAFKSETESTEPANKSFDGPSNKHALMCKHADITQFQNPSTEIEVSEDKSKRSVTAVSSHERFGSEYVNEVSQVVNMIVDSVFEVAVNEKIINESVVEISKNAMENDNSADETLKNENIRDELVSDVLLRLVEDVDKTESDSKIQITKVESLNEGRVRDSIISNSQESVEIPKGTSKMENEINALENETPMEIQHPTCESVEEASQENTCTEIVAIDAAISDLPVSELPLIPDVQPYPVQLFCSAAFDSSVLENFSNDPAVQEKVEYIIPEINPPSNIEALECEVANNSNSSNRASETGRPIRSCGRPDISGPDIFFPFPIPHSPAAFVPLPSANSDPGSSGHITDAHQAPNNRILIVLQSLLESFKKAGEKWRVDVYEKAIFALAKYPKAIQSLTEVQSLLGMSKKIAEKIWQIAQTGHLRQFDDIYIRQSVEIRKLFSRAWGISPRMARKLYREECYSLSDLLTKSSLSRSHLVGLRYYEDLKTKMTKKEATGIFLTVIRIILDKYPEVQCDACSSLRRNKKFCGYVSILVTLPNRCGKNDHRLLPDIVAKLHHLGYLIDDLIRHEENGQQTKYVGIFKLGSSHKHRRIEITVCTREEHATAIFHMTGSSYFNRAIHQWSMKNEVVLDEHSLRIRLLNEQGGTVAVTKFRTPDEKTIFKFLDLPYRAPEQRDRFIM